MAEIDKFDSEILRLLQLEGRMSKLDLSERIGLSPAATLRRVRQLEERRLIRGYAAVLDAHAMERAMTVYVDIALDSERASALDAFERAVALAPEVLECHLMSGDTDYKLKLAVKDLADYERVHRRVLASLPHVAKIRSSFSIRSVVQRVAPMI